MSQSAPGTWHRLHPLSPVVRVGRALFALLVVLLLPFVSGSQGRSSDRIVDLVLLAAAALAGIVSWLVTRWRVEGGQVQVDTGLLRRSRARVPLSRIQSVDLIRPALARVLGLAEVRVRTGGGRDGDARLAYLPNSEAEAVRESLLALARGGPAAEEQPEQLLSRVNTDRLVVGTLLQGRHPLLPALAVVLWIVALKVGPGGASSSLLGVVGGLLFGWVLGLVRQISSRTGYTLAEAGDGLRVGGGLIATVAETIPRRRIQALRLGEPLLWRALGWAYLGADVAGAQRREGETRAAAGQLRTLLPVAPRAEAKRILAVLLPSARPDGGSQPPPQARLKSPLSYHFLRAEVGGGVAMASEGRVARTSTWVPLAKVQSLGWAQGPLQRRLGLATVHLDIAGHQVGVALRDRSVAEALELTERLPGLCRRARETAALPLAAPEQAG